MKKSITKVIAMLGLLLVSVTTVYARPDGVYFLGCDENGHATLYNIVGEGEPYGGCAGGPWTIKVIWQDGGWVPAADPGGGNVYTQTAQLIAALEDLTDEATVEKNDQAVRFFKKQIRRQKNIMRKLLNAR